MKWKRIGKWLCLCQGIRISCNEKRTITLIFNEKNRNGAGNGEGKEFSPDFSAALRIDAAAVSPNWLKGLGFVCGTGNRCLVSGFLRKVSDFGKRSHYQKPAHSKGIPWIEGYFENPLRHFIVTIGFPRCAPSQITVPIDIAIPKNQSQCRAVLAFWILHPSNPTACLFDRLGGNILPAPCS